VLTLHDFSQVCATKQLMRADSVCEGPSMARCLPCATAHYGRVVGPLTAVATAVMRPWKDHAIDHVVSVSRAVAIGNNVRDGPDSSVIPNFVLDSAVVRPDADPAEEVVSGPPSALPEADFMLFVGELSTRKGVPALLRAYESLGRHRPRLMLVGRRTPDTPTQLPAGAEVHLNWPHEHVLAAFRRCRFAVLPSVVPDACPTTVIEAMAAGRAVITTSIGGIVDLVDDGESGLLVPPGSDRELAAAMGRVLADAGLRARLGAGALEKVRAFTASAVAERLEAVYARVAPRSPATEAM
jgi:glycosyltransferase involved in cell wall biosynthesis